MQAQLTILDTAYQPHYSVYNTQHPMLYCKLMTGTSLYLCSVPNTPALQDNEYLCDTDFPDNVALSPQCIPY